MDINTLKQILCGICTAAICRCSQDLPVNNEYGVFIGLDRDDTAVMEPYRIIVIDAQYFTKEDIQALKASGHTVLSYINLGALESFRPYYEEYEKYTLDVYENWEEERWVDVTVPEWQEHMAELSSQIMEKGCEGLFVDNTDVYYHYHTSEVFDGITAILREFKNNGAYISTNGGDVYVSEYAEKYGDLDIIDAVNQETVFSSIDFNSGTFGKNSAAERDYFIEYLDTVSAMGKDVYLLEYTTDKSLIKAIDRFCHEKDYRYYASRTLELLEP